MDAPPIQYAKTSDGVNIAYWAIGQGPRLVILPNLAISNLQLEWQLDFRRIAYARLAERAMVIHYDWRGLGLSQRDCFDLSPEAALRDLEAVVEALRLDRIAVYIPARIFAPFAYLGEHPQRLSHLIVGVAPVPRGFLRRMAALESFIEQDFEMFTECYARMLIGWDAPQATQYAAALRAATETPSNFRLAQSTWRTSRGEELYSMQVPTLILHALGDEGSTRYARVLAGGIPGAHMLGIPGWAMGTGLNETIVNATLDFINTEPAAPGAPIAAPQIDVSAVRTIVFTDVEGSTALNERLGDEAARVVLREHERITRETLSAHGGSEVKAMGDGFMIWFPSATRALECAIALQRAFAMRTTDVGAEQLPDDIANSEESHAVARPLRAPAEHLHIRVGINAGEPIAEGDDLFGASVIAAARICAQGNGGEILVSDVVRQLVAGKGFTFGSPREVSLKGFEDPIRLYEVRWREPG